MMATVDQLFLFPSPFHSMKLSHRLAAGAVALATVAAAAPAFAQSSTPATTGNPAACAAALDAHHTAMMARMEEQFAQRKAAMSTMHAAVQAALHITDADARKEALKAAHDAMRDGKDDLRDERKEEFQDDLASMQEACGDLLPARQGGGKHGRHGRRGGWNMGR